MSERKLLTRRTLLKGAAGSIALLAAACQPQVVEVVKEVPVEKIVTQVVEKEVEVERIVEVEKIVEVAKEPEVDGTFWVLQKRDFFPSFNDWWRAELVKYCDERGWPLDVSYMAGFVGGTPEIEKLIASVAAGTPPDLIQHSLGIVQLRQAYALEAVSDVVEIIEAEWGPNTARSRNDYMDGGQWWAVPYFLRSDGGWYRRTEEAKHGTDWQAIRQYPELWETMLEVTRPDEEMYGWGTTINRSSDGDWFRNRVMHGWGAYKQDETGRFVTFNTPEMVDAMTAMTDLYMNPKWAPMLPPGVLAWTDPTNNEVWLAGKLAYTQNGGTLYAKSILDKNPIAEDTSFHPPCGGPVNAEFNSFSANNWMILRGARNVEVAKQTILNFMLPLENQDLMLSNSPGFSMPAYENLWDASTYLPTHPTVMEMKPVALDTSGVVPGQWPGPPINPAMAAAGAAGIENDMVSDILRGTPVAEAVKTCHDRFVAIFKEFGLPGEQT